MLGCVAAVMDTVSPSHDSPAVIHRTWTSETAVFVRRLAPLHLLQARSALRKLVLDLLAEPRRITLLELERAFVEHLLWGTQILSAHSHSLWQVLLPWLSRLGIRKSLYTQRSRLLHGERVEGDQGLRTGTRVIVAATLHAVIERQTFWKKLREDPDDPERLFDALRSASVKASRVDGVSDYPVMDIWRSRKQDSTSP